MTSLWGTDIWGSLDAESEARRRLELQQAAERDMLNMQAAGEADFYGNVMAPQTYTPPPVSPFNQPQNVNPNAWSVANTPPTPTFDAPLQQWPGMTSAPVYQPEVPPPPTPEYSAPPVTQEFMDYITALEQQMFGMQTPEAIYEPKPWVSSLPDIDQQAPGTLRQRGLESGAIDGWAEGTIVDVPSVVGAIPDAASAITPNYIERAQEDMSYGDFVEPIPALEDVRDVVGGITAVPGGAFDEWAQNSPDVGLNLPGAWERPGGGSAEDITRTIGEAFVPTTPVDVGLIGATGIAPGVDDVARGAINRVTGFGDEAIRVGPAIVPEGAATPNVGPDALLQSEPLPPFAAAMDEFPTSALPGSLPADAFTPGARGMPTLINPAIDAAPIPAPIRGAAQRMTREELEAAQRALLGDEAATWAPAGTPEDIQAAQQARSGFYRDNAVTRNRANAMSQAMDSMAAQPTPVTRFEDLTTAGPVVSGPGRLYHGTGAQFEVFDESLMDGTALFGPGVYLTDDAAIASSYARRRAASTGQSADLLEVTPKPGARLINLEQPLPPDVQAFFRAQDANPTGFAADAWADAVRAVAEGKPGKEVYRAFRDGLSLEGVTVVDAADAIGAINFRLREMGYDGLAHTGGVRGGKKHLVNILFDPTDAPVAGRQIALDPQQAQQTGEQIARQAQNERQLYRDQGHVTKRAEQISRAMDELAAAGTPIAPPAQGIPPSAAVPEPAPKPGLMERIASSVVPPEGAVTPSRGPDAALTTEGLNRPPEFVNPAAPDPADLRAAGGAPAPTTPPLSQGLSGIAKGVVDNIMSIPALAKRAQTTGSVFDASFRQGLPVAFIDPKVWGRNVVRQARAYAERPDVESAVLNEIRKIPGFTKKRSIIVDGQRIELDSWEDVLGVKAGEYQTPGYERTGRNSFLDKVTLPLEARSKKSQDVVYLGGGAEIRNNLVEAARRAKITDQSWYDHYNDIAKVAVSYGDIPAALRGFSNGFYSLRNVAARFQALAQPFTKPGPLFAVQDKAAKGQGLFSASPRGVAARHAIRFAVSEVAGLRALAAVGAATGAFTVGYDPLKNGFGSLNFSDSKGNDYNIDLMGGYGSMIKALARTGAAASDATQGKPARFDPAVEWINFGRHKAAPGVSMPVDTIIMNSPGLSQTPGLRTPYTIDLMDPETYTSGRFATELLPFFMQDPVQGLAEGNIDPNNPDTLLGAAGSLMGGLAGVPVSMDGPTFSEQRDIGRDEVARDLFGQKYDDLDDDAKETQVRNDPRQKPREDAARDESIEMGNVLAANAKQAAIERDAAINGPDGQGGAGSAVDIDRRLQSGQLKGHEARALYDDIEKRLALMALGRANMPEAQEEIRKLNSRPEKDLDEYDLAKKHYYAIFDKPGVRDVQGNLNFYAYDEALAQWEKEHPGYAKERVAAPGTLTPLHADLRAARTQLRPYFQLEDAAWKAAQADEPAFRPYQSADEYVRMESLKMQQEGLPLQVAEKIARAEASFATQMGDIDKLLYLLDNEHLIPLLRKWYSVPKGFEVLDPTYIDELMGAPAGVR